MTSLLGAAGVRGLELVGDGGPLRMSFTELFLFRCGPVPDGRVLPCIELVSDPCLLASFRPVYSSPKKLLSLRCILALVLDLEPVDDTVVALAMDGRRSSPSGKFIPLRGANPGDTCPRFSVESL